MAKRKTKTRRLVDAAFREVNKNPPARVGRTRRKRGKAEAEEQKRAIALSKARAKGARIPKKK